MKYAENFPTKKKKLPPLTPAQRASKPASRSCGNYATFLQLIHHTCSNCKQQLWHESRSSGEAQAARRNHKSFATNSLNKNEVTPIIAKRPMFTSRLCVPTLSAPTPVINPNGSKPRSP